MKRTTINVSVSVLSQSSFSILSKQASIAVQSSVLKVNITGTNYIASLLGNRANSCVINNSALVFNTNSSTICGLVNIVGNVTICNMSLASETDVSQGVAGLFLQVLMKSTINITRSSLLLTLTSSGVTTGLVQSL